MITRISAALFALYVVHGSENVARDSAALADQARKDAPSTLVGLCTDHAEACQDLAMKAVTAKLGGAMSVTKDTAHSAPPPAAKPAATSVQPVLTEAYPLPPRRKIAKI